MTSEGFFLDIAKIAITIVGFAGVVSALRHDRDAPWSIIEIAGLRSMIGHGLASVGFGLLPSLASFLATDECMLWASCSLILALFSAYTLIIQAMAVYRNRRRGAPPRRFGRMLVDFFAFGIAVLVIQGINVVHWRSAAAYAFGCAWLLLVACTQFSIFLLHVKKDTGVKPLSDNKEAAE
jgi:hypothetical protein